MQVKPSKISKINYPKTLKTHLKPSKHHSKTVKNASKPLKMVKKDRQTNFLLYSIDFCPYTSPSVHLISPSKSINKRKAKLLSSGDTWEIING
jgi:hypothetical protein